MFITRSWIIVIVYYMVFQSFKLETSKSYECKSTVSLLCTKVLRQLHWLPVCYRIIFKILLLVYKALNGTAPYYISGLLKYNTSQWELRSSSQHLLVTPQARLKTYGEGAFAVAVPRLWNSIPLELRSSGSIDIFKWH